MDAIEIFNSLPAGATFQLDGIAYRRTDDPAGFETVDATTGERTLHVVASFGGNRHYPIDVRASAELVALLVDCLNCGRELPAKASGFGTPLDDDEVAYLEDPFAATVYDEHDEAWRCGACVALRGDEA